ncbi:MAG: heparinase II/III-family protein [Desulfobacterales bacterium]|nr:heparinase II/III-family protein [Desulfobacterales bacterium]
MARVEREKDRLYYTAFHNGYTRLDHPVHHHRAILFFDQTNFLIRDSFSGTGKHQFQLNFHLHPNITLDRTDRGWVLENGEESIFLRLLDGNLIPVIGTQNPIMGWFSSRYGEKEPTTVLTCTKRGLVIYG